MSLQFIDIVFFIAAFQFSLISFFLIIHKKGKQLSNKILSAFLFSKALSIISYIIIRSGIRSGILYLSLIGAAFSLLYGPLLYLYTKSLLYRDFSLKKSHFAHFFPFIFFLFYMTINFYFSTTSNEGNLITLSEIFNMQKILIFNGFYYLQTFVYIIAAINTLRIYRSEIKKTFSSIKNINISWLSFVLSGFFLIWSIELTRFIGRITIRTNNIFLTFLSIILIFLFANYIVYRGLKQHEIFSGIEEKPKYEKSTLTERDSKHHLTKLKSYMERNKPFLNPCLTIHELAKSLSIKSRHLSQVINGQLNQSFFDFINKYRVEESKRYILNPSNDHMTILQVIFEVGFNSKTAFNRAFKKHTGMTPTEFKKLHRI